MRFNYPSFKLDPNFPQFNLFGLDWLQLKVQSIGVDFRGKFDWDSLIHIAGPKNLDGGALLTDIRLNFGKMPDLIAKSFKELILDFTIGAGFVEGGEDVNVKIGVKVPGLKKLNLDLMQFLKLQAEGLKFDKKEIKGNSVTLMN